MFSTFLTLLLIFSLVGFAKGLIESNRGHSYHNAHIFNLIGAFVWGDTVIFGIFWSIISILSLFLQDIDLFFLVVSIFWAVRSFGEILYWMNQQFSKVVRMKPEKLWFYKYFKNDSVWFIYQIYWQCVLVISIVATIFFANRWLN